MIGVNDQCHSYICSTEDGAGSTESLVTEINSVAITVAVQWYKYGHRGDDRCFCMPSNLGTSEKCQLLCAGTEQEKKAQEDECRGVACGAIMCTVVDALLIQSNSPLRAYLGRLNDRPRSCTVESRPFVCVQAHGAQ